MNETANNIANDVLLTDPHMMDDVIKQIAAYHPRNTIIVISIGVIALLAIVFTFVERMVIVEYNIEIILKLIISSIIIIGLGSAAIAMQNSILCLIHLCICMFVIISFIFKKIFD